MLLMEVGTEKAWLKIQYREGDSRCRVWWHTDLHELALLRTCTLLIVVGQQFLGPGKEAKSDFSAKAALVMITIQMKMAHAFYSNS